VSGTRVTVRVPAKVNLHLSVGPVRKDGFHELVTVYHAISLYDEVVVEPAERISVTLTGEGADQLPIDDDNLAVRAVRAVAALLGREPEVAISVRKGIPVAGGLAGGSADAAATWTQSRTPDRQPPSSGTMRAPCTGPRARRTVRQTSMPLSDDAMRTESSADRARIATVGPDPETIAPAAPSSRPASST
jgi:hypothetical protein